LGRRNKEKIKVETKEVEAKEGRKAFNQHNRKYKVRKWENTLDVSRRNRILYIFNPLSRTHIPTHA
jgi:hypothetical protein